MYSSAFCRAYNEFGWNVYPEVFAEQLLLYLEREGVRVDAAVDLGCGTGVLCAALAQKGVDVSGVDLSEGMIAIARETCPEGSFTPGDMVSFVSGEKADLVTCTGDALNHVFDPEDIRRMFLNVSSYLRPGGLLVFDLLRESEIPPDEPFELDYSDTVRAVFRTAREEDGAVRLNIRVFENGELQTEENILEKLHDPEMICSLVRDAGLEVLRCADTLLPDSAIHGSTWFIVARKPSEENI